MKKRLCLLLAVPVVSLLAGIAGGGCATERERPVVVVVSPKDMADAPPPSRVEVRPVSPGGEHVWTSGYWTRVDYRWVWIPGAWTEPGVAVGGGVDIE